MVHLCNEKYTLISAKTTANRVYYDSIITSAVEYFKTNVIWENLDISQDIHNV